MTTPAKRVEVKTRTTRQLRARFAKVADRNGRSVSAELEQIMRDHVERVELELDEALRARAAGPAGV